MKAIKQVLIFLVILIALSVSACAAQPAVSESVSNDEILFTIEGADKTELTMGEFLALEQCTYSITRTNSKGETTTGDYTGVKWENLAETIGAPDDAQSVTLIASDGYSQAYTMDIFSAEKSIFAIEKDREPITLEEENGQVWFCADESYTANYWTKFITKIVID